LFVVHDADGDASSTQAANDFQTLIVAADHNGSYGIVYRVRSVEAWKRVD
jgi:hypothetical protein